MERGAYVLAGDIGGTKTHLGLFVKGRGRPRIKALQTYSSRHTPDIETIIESFLERYPHPIAGACLGIAGPIIRGRSHITNLCLEVSETALQKRFGWPHVRLINDLIATAHGLSLLNHSELFPLNSRKIRSKENRALVAPGTGLGVAFIVCENRICSPVASEGGHMDFAPGSEDEWDLFKFLSQRYGHVSIERVLTGAGLHNIYQWLLSKKRYREPKWLQEGMREMDPAEAISNCALKHKDPLCIASLERFVSILGAVAGNMALIAMATGGVYLGGGIAPKILPMLKESLFIRSFVNKGRYKPFMEKIALRVILNDKTALMGAAHVALQHIARLGCIRV
ncbi:MAG: glucokinase [Deltaproteobacteria bacterium]|nr:glucokinase [Deltaproteobacteria bacterium]MBW1962420.1 glucokinase [Deltaproteobacteria bacterium]MBW1994308.1 glucokinase [Deltaproteobacteria bacterium]MBW2150358.1 glucokinase [Deltaproteobacteria bacterium]